jgi:isopenicillin-N epimerase
LQSARAALGEFVGADPTDLVFVPNPTFAVNTIARSLRLKADDEVLTTNHEYGACLFAWRFMSQKRGYRLVEQRISLPVSSRESLIDQFWQGVSPRTRVIFLSHITSPTALTMPVEEICRRARDVRILTVIDGAHVPGQINLNITELDADFYTGACHKWLCAPKGSSFFHARRDRQQLIEPLVVGWGWGDEKTVSIGSDFLNYHQWLGTIDFAAYLSVPAAIQYQSDNNWPEVQVRCHKLARSAVERAAEITHRPPLYPAEFHRQMGLIELPPVDDLDSFKSRLYDDYRIEIPTIAWQERQFLRVSVQAYNTQADIDALIDALGEMLPQAAKSL